MSDTNKMKTCEDCENYEWEDLDGLYWCAVDKRIFDDLSDIFTPNYEICEKFEDNKEGNKVND